MFDSQKLLIAILTRGLSFQELSRRAKVSVSQINAILNHGAIPRVTTIHKLAAALSCKVTDLLTEKGGDC